MDKVKLTERQQEVYKMRQQGASYNEIARILKISPQRAHQIMQKVEQKLKIKNEKSIQSTS